MCFQESKSKIWTFRTSYWTNSRVPGELKCCNAHVMSLSHRLDARAPNITMATSNECQQKQLNESGVLSKEPVTMERTGIAKAQPPSLEGTPHAEDYDLEVHQCTSNMPSDVELKEAVERIISRQLTLKLPDLGCLGGRKLEGPRFIQIEPATPVDVKVSHFVPPNYGEPSVYISEHSASDDSPQDHQRNTLSPNCSPMDACYNVSMTGSSPSSGTPFLSPLYGSRCMSPRLSPTASLCSTWSTFSSLSLNSPVSSDPPSRRSSFNDMPELNTALETVPLSANSNVASMSSETKLDNHRVLSAVSRSLAGMASAHPPSVPFGSAAPRTASAMEQLGVKVTVLRCTTSDVATPSGVATSDVVHRNTVTASKLVHQTTSSSQTPVTKASSLEEQPCSRPRRLGEDQTRTSPAVHQAVVSMPDYPSQKTLDQPGYSRVWREVKPSKRGSACSDDIHILKPVTEGQRLSSLSQSSQTGPQEMPCLLKSDTAISIQPHTQDNYMRTSDSLFSSPAHISLSSSPAHISSNLPVRPQSLPLYTLSHDHECTAVKLTTGLSSTTRVTDSFHHQGNHCISYAIWLPNYEPVTNLDGSVTNTSVGHNHLKSHFHSNSHPPLDVYASGSTSGVVSAHTSPSSVNLPLPLSKLDEHELVYSPSQESGLSRLGRLWVSGFTNNKHPSAQSRLNIDWCLVEVDPRIFLPGLLFHVPLCCCYLNPQEIMENQDLS